jgi:hypothetical protein
MEEEEEWKKAWKLKKIKIYGRGKYLNGRENLFQTIEFYCENTAIHKKNEEKKRRES